MANDAAADKCAVCDSTDVTRCTGCLDHRDDNGVASPIYYCGKACQSAHWPEHKKACKPNATTRLFRAGELLQKIFYVYRKHAFDHNIMKVANKDGKLVVHTDYSEPNKPFFAFPNDAVHNLEDEQALLAFKACGDAVGIFHKLITKVLFGKHLSCYQDSV